MKSVHPGEIIGIRTQVIPYPGLINPDHLARGIPIIHRCSSILEKAINPAKGRTNLYVIGFVGVRGARCTMTFGT